MPRKHLPLAVVSKKGVTRAILNCHAAGFEPSDKFRCFHVLSLKLLKNSGLITTVHIIANIDIFVKQLGLNYYPGENRSSLAGGREIDFS